MNQLYTLVSKSIQGIWNNQDETKTSLDQYIKDILKPNVPIEDEEEILRASAAWKDICWKLDGVALQITNDTNLYKLYQF